MTADVAALAEDFVGQLNGLFEAVFEVEDAFAIVATDDDVGRRIGIGPFGSTSGGFSRFPLRRHVDADDRLFLNAQFDVALDGEGTHLMVRKSVFGLWVRPAPTWKSPTPVFRIEYDRETTGGKPSAHVHIHADSAELGWIIGSAGQPLRRHAEIHFPVGGRRFRPTVEDLLLFLDHEELFTDWPNKGWRQTVIDSRQRFEDAQARATVRRYPEIAVQQLRAAGYHVEGPNVGGPRS